MQPTTRHLQTDRDGALKALLRPSLSRHKKRAHRLTASPCRIALVSPAVLHAPTLTAALAQSGRCPIGLPRSPLSRRTAPAAARQPPGAEPWRSPAAAKGAVSVAACKNWAATCMHAAAASLQPALEGSPAAPRCTHEAPASQRAQRACSSSALLSSRRTPGTEMVMLVPPPSRLAGAAAAAAAAARGAAAPCGACTARQTARQGGKGAERRCWPLGPRSTLLPPAGPGFRGGICMGSAVQL